MEVLIKKFAELENCNFTAPCTIEGKNKLGKTTILNAVSWCFFGKNLYGQEMGVAIYAEHDTPEERVADVSITLAGDTFQRIAKSTFTREGKLKSRISTTCRINGVEMSETEYTSRIGVSNLGKISLDLLCTNPLIFLNMDYKDKKLVLDNVVKRVNPQLAAFDLNAAVEQRKAAKRAVNANAKEQEYLRKKIAETLIPSVTPISADLQAAEAQYQTANANSDAIKALVSENTAKIAAKNDTLNAISKKIGELELSRMADEKEIATLETRTFAPFAPNPLPEVDTKEYETAKNVYEIMPIYADIKEFWAGENAKYAINPLYIDLQAAYDNACNMQYNGVATCPVSGAECSTASEAAEKAFESEKADRVKATKQRLLNYINDLFASYRSQYEQAKRNYEQAEKALAEQRSAHSKALAEQLALKQEYEEAKIKFENDLKADKITATAHLQRVVDELEAKKAEFAALKNEPLELQEVPQTISEELQKAHNEYVSAKAQYEKECGAAKYAEETKAADQRKLQEMKEQQQANLSELEAVNAAIMDYIHNLEDALTLTFAGKYRINFVMTSQTLDGEINDDVCEVIVNGHKHLNEATTVNAGMQILTALRKLYNKNTPVLIDRTESVNEVDTYGNDVIMTKVTMDEKLIIKPLNN